MVNQFFFRKGRGAIFFFALSLFTLNAYAQSPATPILVNCGQLSVEIVPRPFTGSNDQANCTCGKLFVYATLSWDPADFNGADSLQFNQLRVILDFTMDNGISILQPTLEKVSCPTSGNDPINCPGACLQYGGSTVSLCINTASSFTVENNARIVIPFSAPSGCIQKATVRKMSLLRPGNQVCQPDVNPPVVFPYCSPADYYIKGDIATEQKCWIEEVAVTTAATNTGAPASCDDFVLTGTNNDECSPYTSSCLCNIAQTTSYLVTPTKSDNPLNGVSTFDLVLISRHVLGLESLAPPVPPATGNGSTFKLIAADANNSNSITSIDIVELRKLILGIYGAPPGTPWPHKSWRFVDKAFVFPNIYNPFVSTFPESKTLTALPNLLVDFTGVKIGDVNNSALTNCTLNADPDLDECHAFERPAGAFSLYEPKRNTIKTGAYYTLPVRAGSDVPLIAWQSAFRFDPDQLELIGPSLGDLPGLTADNFNLAQADEGIVRALWFAPAEDGEAVAVAPGQTLFHLTFRAKQDLPEQAQLLAPDAGLMPGWGWTADGAPYTLQNAPADQRNAAPAPNAQAWVRCQPNPSAGEVIFDILALPQPRRAQLTVFDAFGRRLWWRDLGKETGPVQISVPEAAAWPSGVYRWELRFDQQKSAGSFIRQ